jgi:hypothetical protein
MSVVITAFERMIGELKALQPTTQREQRMLLVVISFLERFVRKG